MYKKHVILLISIGILTLSISCYFKWQYKVITSDVMAFISIAIGLYIAAISFQFGNKMSEYMKKQDKRVPTKTHMGVLCTYLKYATYTGFLAIVDSCSVLIISDMTYTEKKENTEIICERYPELLRIFSSIGFSLFSVSLIFSIIIFNFILFSNLNYKNKN